MTPSLHGALLPAALGASLLVAVAAVALAVLGHWTAAVALAIAGLAKGPVYRFVPRGPAPDRKFVWRELAFGACVGAALDLSLLLEVLP